LSLKMFAYSSKEAYNSCLSLFPTLLANQQFSVPLKKEETQDKVARMTILKLQREQNRNKQRRKGKALSSLNVESQSQIIDDKGFYASEIPKYCASTDSKINFISSEQFDQFDDQLLSDNNVILLMEMFPSINVAIFCSKYRASHSLEAAIDILVGMDSSPVITTVVDDIANTALWPTLPNHHKSACSIMEHSSDAISLKPLLSNSSVISTQQSPTNSNSNDVSDSVTNLLNITEEFLTENVQINEMEEKCVEEVYVDEDDSELIIISTERTSFSEDESDWIVI